MRKMIVFWTSLTEEEIKNLLMGVILIIIGIVLTIPVLTDWLPYKVHPWNDVKVMVNVAVKVAFWAGLGVMTAGIKKFLE